MHKQLLFSLFRTLTKITFCRKKCLTRKTEKKVKKKRKIFKFYQIL